MAKKRLRKKLGKMTAEEPTEPDAPRPALVPQQHGGALYAGGVPGNNGGGCRPRTEIRDRSAHIFDTDGINFLHKVIKGEKVDVDVIESDGTVKAIKRIATIKERKEAIDSVARVGLGEHHEATVDDIRSRLERTVAICRDRLSTENLTREAAEGRLHLVCPDLLARLQPVWAA